MRLIINDKNKKMWRLIALQGDISSIDVQFKVTDCKLPAMYHNLYHFF